MRRGALLIAALMLAGAIATALAPMDRAASLRSVLALWADLLRDADDAISHLAPMTIDEEMRLGRPMATSVRASCPVDNTWTPYVNAVGQSLVKGVRRDAMVYRFTVLDTPGVNAFALPGGEVFVLRGLLEKLENEAELVAVLGHEMAHIDLAHCAHRYQWQVRLRGVGAVMDLARVLIVTGYRQFEETEADTHGVGLALAQNYNPVAAIRVFHRLAQPAAAPRAAANPVEEAARAAAETLGEYGRSHPSSKERADALRQWVGPRQARTGYVGARNFKERKPKNSATYREEWQLLNLP